VSARAWIRDNGLSLFFLVLFIATVGGQATAGWKQYNDEARDHGEAAISFTSFLTSSQFGQAVMENWQSEFLQFSLYIVATIWLFQRGSSESKQSADEIGLRTDEEEMVGRHARPDSPRLAKGSGPARTLYSYSLLILMTVLFLGSWFAHSATGWTQYNQERADHGAPEVSYVGFLRTPDFWNQTLQNWQSEFLAVGSMAIFSVYLRQRGSPESKEVGAPHVHTGGED
jgi:hypothetical protein